MAVPISNIKKQPITEEQIKEQKVENLKKLLSDNEEAITQVFTIMAELNDMGALEAATKLLESKEEVTHIALDQINRKPVTNMINHVMSIAGALSELDPETTKKLLDGVNNGLDKANKAIETNEKISAFKLIKLLNDPDVNRALLFGVHFLKGVGKGLRDEV